MIQSSIQPFVREERSISKRPSHPNLHLSSLVGEKKVVRIVNPHLQDEIERQLANGRSLDPIFHFRGQLYLSLQKISDASRREEIFNLIRQYQVAQTHKIETLPKPLQTILEKPAKHGGHFISSLTISTFLGGLSGILALALCVIGLMIGGVSTFSEAGMKITAAAFAIGSVLGCLICTAVLWVRLRQFSLQL